jgi:hypothetical protein
MHSSTNLPTKNEAARNTLELSIHAGVNLDSAFDVRIVKVRF